MDVSRIVKALEEKRSLLDTAIAEVIALNGHSQHGAAVAGLTIGEPPPPPITTRKVSAAARRKMSLAQKARWVARRKAAKIAR